MTTKLFISYRSRDYRKVDKVAVQLESLTNDSNEPLFSVWQDKREGCIKPGQDWWEAILDAIEDCDVFVFMISHQSVGNINCRAELRYAHELGKPILPFVLEGEFYTDEELGKPNLRYWDDLPDELGEDEDRIQCQFQYGNAYISEFKEAINDLVARGWPVFPAERPPNPGLSDDPTNDIAQIYDQGWDFAFAGEFTSAKKRFRKVARWNNEHLSPIAKEWISIIVAYEKIVDYSDKPSRKFAATQLRAEYVKSFPKPFLEGIFDPYNLVEHLLVTRTENKIEILSELKANAEAIRTIIGEPFEWCYVPAGAFMYGEYNWPLELSNFAIAKYPITYKQFQVYVDNGGLHDAIWWRFLEGYRNSPGYQVWKIDTRPRENVSWYDAIAFCRWLSVRLGSSCDLNQVDMWGVRLPTEFEWEKAARGEKGLLYPWDNEFRVDACNTKASGLRRTTSVMRYAENTSPYGVMDMSGNVWEWCLSIAENPQVIAMRENLYTDRRRVLRGGSWFDAPKDARTIARFNFSPDKGSNDIGFRIMRPL